MKKINFKILLIILISVITCSSIYSQTPTYDEHITITAPYRPSVSDANKIDNEPIGISLDMDKDKLDYDMTNFKANTKPTEISGLNIPDYKFENDKMKQHIFYAKLGFGSNLEPLAHISVNSTDNKKVSGGFNILHNSAWRKISPEFNNTFSDSHFDIYGKVKFGNQQIKLTPFINHNKRYYSTIHYPDSTVFPISTDDDITAASYINYGANLELSNVKTLNTDYYTAIKFYSTIAGKRYTEYQVSVPFNFSYYSKVFRNSSHEILNFDIMGQYDYQNMSMFSNNLPNVTDGNYLVKLTPNYTVIAGRLKLKLGVDVNMYSQDNNTTSENYFNFAIHPIAEIKTYIIPDVFSFTIGIKGQSYRNNLTKLLEANKYVEPLYKWHIVTNNLFAQNIGNIPIKVTNEAFDVYANLTTRLGKNINLSVGANLLDIKDKPIFHTSLITIGGEDYNRCNQFNYVYENIKQIIVNGRLSIDYDMISAALGGKYIGSKISNEQDSYFNSLNITPKVYNTPKFIVDGRINVKLLNKKLELGLLSYCIGGVEDVNYVVTKDETSISPEVVQLPLMYDLFFTAKYNFNDNIGVWFNANSLMHYKGNRLQLYNYYPEYPMNVMGGITLSF